MRILLVKMSSMGDVVHNLPVASDLPFTKGMLNSATLKQAQIGRVLRDEAISQQLFDVTYPRPMFLWLTRKSLTECKR